MRAGRPLPGRAFGFAFLALGAALLLAGCTSVGMGGAPDLSGLFGGDGGERAPRNLGLRPLPQSGGDILSSRDLLELYQAVIESYVEPVDHSRLITGASRGAQDGSIEAGLLPVESAVFYTKPLSFSGDAGADWFQWAEIYESFVRKLVNRVNLIGIGQGAARGMLQALDDPNSVYLSRRTLQNLQSSEYAGIGVVLSPGDGREPPVIREVLANGPAEQAGLRPGDAILAVNGRSTRSTPLSEIAEAIRGPEGTRVSLAVRSPDQESPRNVDTSRALVRRDDVVFERRGDIDTIGLRTFREGTADLIRRTLVQSAASGARGWVIDVRGNSDGSLQEAINLASLFVGERTIALQEDRTRRRAPIRGTSRSLSVLLPTVILVDGATGWGAEIFAAALHDYDLATILGVRTSGKTGLATTLELPDGSIAQITSQRVLSPSGAALHRTGLPPDELVESQPAQWAQGQDPELEAALALLRK